jgi:class 3 adenylate cyclase/tetratricopeptide (TPR) repeat protein
MNDIAAWLENIGLGQYAERFRANDITAAVVSELTNDDLRELGLSLGHRRLLLKAIKDLEGAEIAAAHVAMPSMPARNLVTCSRGERRQLTVMIADLVGSTGLAAKLDPEDMGQVIRAYQEACIEAVERWDGQITRFMGDGVFAIFGYPRAREDDAEWAVRAGLDLTEVVANLKAGNGSTLAARVGIATGVVMIGELIGQGPAQEETVVGETPNLAARLQVLAGPGQVVIAGQTRRVVSGLFEFVDLGPQRLKGFPEPLMAWQVLGESGAESRFEAVHGERPTPLVGREHEIGLLLENWERVKEGEGQVVLLAGEPGIGKSRIVRTLRERLADEPLSQLSYCCSPYHASTALHPVVSSLERGAGFVRDDEAEAKLDKLGALLARCTEALTEAVPLVAALLGIETNERYPVPALTSQGQKQRTIEVLVEQVEGLAAKQPVLAVYEDVHWVDPTTLELLGLLIERVRRLPVLVLITFRPEFGPPWSGHAHVMQLSLSRLTRRHGQALVAAVTGGKALPDDVLDQILAKTDGVPLFVEELTKTVLESGLLTDAGDHYALAGPLVPLAIPATLRDSLMARLDRMGSAKIVAQIGAVLGHRFELDLIRLMWDGSNDLLDYSLKQLTHASLLAVCENYPITEFEFKHALMGDVAYDSLLRPDRRRYHLRAAEVLNSHFPRLVDERPDLVARHYSGAGQSIPAFEFWCKASEVAARRSANKESLTYIDAAHDELTKVENIGSAEIDECRLKLLMTRAPVLISLRGWSAREVHSNYDEALRIARSLGESSHHLFDIWRGLYNVYVLHGNLRQAEEATGRLRDIAVELNDDDLLLSWHRAVGLCDFLAASFEGASAHMDEAMASFDPTKHARHTYVQGSHPAVVAYSISAWAHWFRGHPERAAMASTAAISAAERAEHPFSLAYALCLASSFAQCRDRADEALSLAESALALSTLHQFPYWQAWANIVKGWSLAALDKPDEGVQVLKDGITKYESTGAAQIKGYALCLLAEACSRTHSWQEAFEAADSALAESRKSGIVFYEPEAHRLQGESLCRLGQRLAGLRALLRAVRIANRQRSGPMLLRASVSLLHWLERDRLRTSVIARVNRVLAQMERTCLASELESARLALSQPPAARSQQRSVWIDAPCTTPHDKVKHEHTGSLPRGTTRKGGNR